SMKATESNATRLKAIKSAPLAIALGLFVLAGGTSQATANPFAKFTGTWAGNGVITVQDGTSERIRCRARFAKGQSIQDLVMSLRCASDSYKMELQSEITYDRGRISGSWNEAS